MYSILKELHSPTVVEFCCYCNFFSSKKKSLVVAGSSYIRIYRQLNGTLDEDGHPAKEKLEQAAHYPLFGTLTSMQFVRLPDSPRDSLVLSFKDAKMSIVEYDPLTHDLKTVSMHCYETEECKGDMTDVIDIPMVRSDPGNRCTAMLIYGHNLVVLPFRQEPEVGDDDFAVEGSRGKSPLLSPSYVVNLLKLNQKICNVTDMQFLDGYHEPTLMLLYEPVQTYAGRIAVRQDTHFVAAISLNMREKVSPIIWTVSGLPFDANQILPVPRPLGGVLVLCNNSFIYLNQSAPPYGVSLNSMTDNSTLFPLRPQMDAVVTLENSLATFLSNTQVVLSLKGGEIYVVTILTDGLRAVHGFTFEKAAGSVLASCICKLKNGFLFFGSCLGNSLLLKYQVKDQQTETIEAAAELEDESPVTKKPKLYSTDSKPNDSFLTDPDEIEVYGEVKNNLIVPSHTQYQFEEEFQNGPNKEIELVCCSGYGKNGALSVLQRNIHPQVVTTFELPACTDMWTVFSSKKESGNDLHSFLILSREDSTMVLQTGAEIMELDSSGFNTQYPTVFAGNICDNKYILQVCPMSVRLLSGDNQVLDVEIKNGTSSIVSCCLCDPYLILLTANGSIMYGQVDDSGSQPCLNFTSPLESGCKIQACHIYKDMSGLFTCEIQEEEDDDDEEIDQQMKDEPTKLELRARAKRQAEAEEEEDFLYGSNESSENEEMQTGNQNISNAKSKSKTKIQSSVAEETFWCVVVRENNSLEIFSVPDFQLVFVYNNFSNAPKLLLDSGHAESIQSSSGVPCVHEITMAGLGYNSSRPHLVAIIDKDLVIYEVFTYPDKQLENHLAIRFKKLNHSVLIRPKQEFKLPPDSKDIKNQPGGCIKVPRLRVFENIASYKGIFVCGSLPYWLFVTSRGALRSHPMDVDGPATSFAEFNNVNCPNGFLYFNQQEELRICVLPTHFTYDAMWPVRKVPLRETPYHVAYNLEHKVYAIATTRFEPHKKIPKFHTEEREFDDVERDSRFIYPQLDRFVIQLISPVNWEIVPNTRYELEEFEHVTGMKNVYLASEETHSGRKSFLALSTTYNYGEDLCCRGRILIFDIVEVVPEPGQPLTKYKTKCLYAKEQKGPVTTLCSIQGYLLTAVGQKIYIWNFTEKNDLVGVAFIDTQVFIHNAICIKNFILLADITNSIQLLRFQEEYKTLSLVSRDTKPLEVNSVEFFVDGAQLGFVVCDYDQNVMIFNYQPEALESFGGQRLLQKAEINLGCNVNTMFRVQVKKKSENGFITNVDNRHVTYLATLNGGISALLPMPEKTYRRLMMLQNKLVDCMHHVAGLNPRAFRAMKLSRRILTNPHRNIVDGLLLEKFLHMSFTERDELARKIGTTSKQVLDDLMDVERAVSHF